MTTVLAFFGRVLIALLFVTSGINKVFAIGGTETMLASVGLPTGLAWPTALFEVAAGLALIFGVWTRFVALLLAGFCLVSAFFFHNDFADPMQAAMLLKNVAIAGGLLCLCALDSVRWSYDAMRQRRRTERAVHDAEVREARAEGAAAGARSREVAESGIRGRTVVTDADGDGVPDRDEGRRF